MTADTREQRIDTLTRAARAKHTAAQARAEAGLRTLIKSGQPITFRSVAKTAGVSLDFLYRNPELRQRIDTLRAQQQPARQTADPTTPATSVVARLTAKLGESREQITQLRAQLATAHGELAALRRTARTASTPPDPQPPSKTPSSRTRHQRTDQLFHCQ